jgi:hypothetical protein
MQTNNEKITPGKFELFYVKYFIIIELITKRCTKFKSRFFSS